ncbi:MAG: FtsX-like permease family protein [Bryobacteraceae bacterium]
MILFRLVSWPYLRKHLFRGVLTTAGIVLGVAVFVGMHAANQAVLSAFNQTVDRIAGKTQLQVAAGEAGFDEAVLERVQSVPGVRAAAPVIEAVVETGLPGQGNLLILAVDMTGDRSLREYDLEGGDEDIIDDPLLFLAQPDSIIVTTAFAARNNLRNNSRISMQTMEGPKDFVVRGIMRDGGLGSAFGGNIAVMDIYAAQKVFGRGRRFDRIDLAVNEGEDFAEVQRKLLAALGPGFTVETPAGRGVQFESLLRVYSAAVNMSSLFALFIGMFLIYNSFSIAVGERRSEIGILRALGATRRQIGALFIGESAIGGFIGSLAGVAFGIFLAEAIAGQVGSLIEGLYGVAEKAEDVAADPGLIAAALSIGTVTSVIAAIIPARSAARVDPVQALQKGKFQVLSSGENRLRRWLALVLLAAALLCLPFGSNRFFFYGGYMLLIVAALLFTPTLALWLARLLRTPLRRLRPVEGALAADSLLQAPRRTSATVAALMLSLAMVVALGGTSQSSYRAIRNWLDSALNPDLFLSPSQDMVSRTFHFPGGMREEIERIPGVEHVQTIRANKITFRDTPVLLIAAEMDRLGSRVKNENLVVAGDPDTLYAEVGQARGFLVAQNLAELHGLSLNDAIAIPTPSGILRLPVSGIVRDFSDQQGSIFIDRATYLKHWKDDTVDTFRIYIGPGESWQAVKGRILERFAGRQRLFVLSNREMRDYILGLTDQWFAMTYIQTAIAVLVAILGIVNTLTVSIADRKRELGVLRAVGGLRNQIRGTLWLEAMSIGAIGLILGLALGAVNLYYQLRMVRQDFSGMAFDYEFPWYVAMILAPIILGSAWSASMLPAESAVRSSLVEALEYE